jgi:hypothetical protein
MGWWSNAGTHHVKWGESPVTKMILVLGHMLPCRNPDSCTDADDAGKFLPINNIPDKAGCRVFMYAHLVTSALQQPPPHKDEHDPALDPDPPFVTKDEADSSSDIPNNKLAYIVSQFTTPSISYLVCNPIIESYFLLVGFHRKPLEVSSKKYSKFKFQTAAGITVGHSDFTNGMFFGIPSHLSSAHPLITSLMSVAPSLHLDQQIWIDSYAKEYEGCKSQKHLWSSHVPRMMLRSPTTIFSIVCSSEHKAE